MSTTMDMGLLSCFSVGSRNNDELLVPGDVEGLAHILGCRVVSLPIRYLCLPFWSFI
jgi:hypothetical protein